MAKKIFDSTERRHVWQRISLVIVLGLGVYLILPQVAVLKNSLQVVEAMLLWVVGLALIAQVLSYIGSGYLLQKTLAIAQEGVSLLRSTLIVLGAASISMVAGGLVGSSAAIYRWTRGKGDQVEGATLASLLPSLFNDFVLVLVSIFGLIYLLLVHNLDKIQVIGFTIILVILGIALGTAILAMRYRDRTVAVFDWIQTFAGRLMHRPVDTSRVRKEVDNLFDAWEVLWQRGWHLLALGALLNVVFDMLTLFFMFVASGQNIGIGVLIAGYGLPILLGKIAFILPGGLGVVETGMTAIYKVLGVPGDVAVVVVLGYRLISFWIPSISGFPIAAYLQSQREKSKS